MEVVYTIGATQKYDSLLKELGPGALKKMGRREDYSGGWVWKTIEEAESFIEEHVDFEASVYELELRLGWKYDVSAKVDEDGVHRLLYDAKVVKKVK